MRLKVFMPGLSQFIKIILSYQDLSLDAIESILQNARFSISILWIELGSKRAY